MLLACNVISGFVYQDANNNGLFDPASPRSPTARSSSGTPRGSSSDGRRPTPRVRIGSRRIHDRHGDSSITQTVNFSGGDVFAHGARPAVRSGTWNVDLCRDRQSRFHPGRIKSEISSPAFRDQGECRRVADPELAGGCDRYPQIDESGSFKATHFDGILDYAGTSGIDFGPSSRRTR